MRTHATPYKYLKNTVEIAAATRVDRDSLVLSRQINVKHFASASRGGDPQKPATPARGKDPGGVSRGPTRGPGALVRRPHHPAAVARNPSQTGSVNRAASSQMTRGA